MRAIQVKEVNGRDNTAFYTVVDTSNKRFIVHRSSPPPKVGELIVLKGFSGDKLMWVIKDAKK